MGEFIGWVSQEGKLDTFCPVRKDRQLVIGLTYMSKEPPGKLIGTFLYNN